MTISDEHLIPGEVWYDQLAPDYPIVRVANQYGSATIALHGAHVIDYIPCDQTPVIFTSLEAIYKEGKAIRGGIPICWPWFNAHPSNPNLPSHGVARTRFWELTKSLSRDNCTELIFKLPIDAATEFGLSAQLTVRVGSSLNIEITAHNISNQIVPVGGALHSYFVVSDIDAVRLDGFDGEAFIDTTDETEHRQDGEIYIQGEVDRIYDHGTTPITIKDPGLARDITIHNGGSNTTVVWNPWQQKAAALADLIDEEYLGFVCVEASNARHDTRLLQPGTTHTLSTNIVSTPHG